MMDSTYYRSGGLFVKVESPTTTKSILLKADGKAPERWSSTYPSEERLQEAITLSFGEGRGDAIAEADYRQAYYTFKQQMKQEFEQVEKITHARPEFTYHSNT